MILCQFVSENMIAEEKTDICCVVLKDILLDGLHKLFTSVMDINSPAFSSVLF